MPLSERGTPAGRYLRFYDARVDVRLPAAQLSVDHRRLRDLHTGVAGDAVQLWLLLRADHRV